MTIEQLEQIEKAFLVQGKNAAQIAKEVGLAAPTVSACVAAIAQCRAGAWDGLKETVRKYKTVRTNFLGQLQSTLNIVIPTDVLEVAKEMEEENVKQVQRYQASRKKVQESAKDMTGEFCLKMLTNQAAQTETMKALLEQEKSLLPSILAEIQRLNERLKRIETAIQDAAKETSGDIKDNLNANADILRQELNTIKINTRKRGL